MGPCPLTLFQSKTVARLSFVTKCRATADYSLSKEFISPSVHLNDLIFPLIPGLEMVLLKCRFTTGAPGMGQAH